MLGAAADAAQLAQAAPWLAVGALALAAAAWVYRQSRKQLAELRALVTNSATRQGVRLGDLERETGLLDLRRRQVEAVLLDEGTELPYWPPDGPQQPRPRRGRHVVDDQGDADDPPTEYRPLPVPPLDPAVAVRHRR